MGILRDGMNIKCRTQDEFDYFFEVANKEGYIWESDEVLEPYSHLHVPMSFQLGSQTPHRVMYSSNIEWDRRTLTNVEADKLFRNLLISRRAKHGTD